MFLSFLRINSPRWYNNIESFEGGAVMRQEFSLTDILLMHFIDGHHRSKLTDYIINSWIETYNKDPREVLSELLSRNILEERANTYKVAPQYRYLLEETSFIYDITQERPKLLDAHKAYLMYENNRNTPKEELLIQMYDDILAYNTDPKKHQQAHARLSELFLESNELNHSENHMHCAQMMDLLLQMESTLITVKTKADVDQVRARFPIKQEFLERYKSVIYTNKRTSNQLREDILLATRQLNWDVQHKEAVASYIVLRAQDDPNAERFLLAHLFRSAKVRNLKSMQYVRKYRLDEKQDDIRVMATERRPVNVRRPIEVPEQRYEMRSYDSQELQTQPLKEKPSNNFLIIFFLIVFFPVGLILMWLGHWRRWVKITISIVYGIGVLNLTSDEEQSSVITDEADYYYEEEYDPFFE